ncbi:hypothetical protein [Streptomyces gobiensis]|uniref:hypothetical protein n=1 Tax=Streptomyces gobiensis TaxID=2875706 RepID=UPI001E3DB6A8|nr:hypothetical protein [Streptomyces gobiensis]UGY93513.1 hypothetical protein test1122_18480 [Streptomyces gobiensis]
MNTPGTIDHPSPYGPMKQDPMHDSTFDTPARSRPEETGSPQNRNREMQLMPETLARARMHDELRRADSQRVAQRLINARRMQRKAERASLRARRALAMAVMQ